MIMLGSNGFALNYEYTMCPDKERWGHFIYPSTPDPPNPSSSQIRCSTKFYDGTNTQINANMMFAASRPRNIALRAIIKYK